MMTPKGQRCDSCSKFAEKKDVFKKFAVARFDPVTKQITGGIAGESNPKIPAVLHSCPTCETKIKLASKLNDPNILPPGPLRNYFERARSKDILRHLSLH